MHTSRVLALMGAMAMVSVASAIQMPTLNHAVPSRFAKAYSCGGNYSVSALFFSSAAKQRNDPVLLLNGSPTASGQCTSLQFEAATAGADLGLFKLMPHGISLLDLTWHAAMDYPGEFLTTAPATPGAVYAVFHITDSARVFYFLQVNDVSRAGQVLFTYAIKNWQWNADASAGMGCTGVSSASGFSWSATNAGPAQQFVMPTAPGAFPKLNVQYGAKIPHSYGCGNSTGYGATAVDLTVANLRSNNPDMVWYGACGGSFTLLGATAGDDIALVTDLGTGASLGDITTLDVYRSASGFVPSDQKVIQAGHTYAMVRSVREARGVVVFSVSDITASTGSASLTFAVKLLESVPSACMRVAPGFGWTTPSHI